MMRRLREIPCRMLARTAVQPRVLVALIQCATMATEVVEVATESEEDVVINCVAIFYEEGKEGKNFRRAVRFNSRLLNSLRDKKVTIPEETFFRFPQLAQGRPK